MLSFKPTFSLSSFTFISEVAQSCPTLCDSMPGSSCQAPLSVGFPRQEYRSELLSPSPGVPDPGIEPGSPALQADSLPSEPPGKPRCSLTIHKIHESTTDLADGTGNLFCKGFPSGTSGKEPTWQSRICKRLRFDPWVGKIPWGRTWQPTPVILPGESHGQRSLVGYSA